MAHYTDKDYSPTDAELEYHDKTIKPKHELHTQMVADCKVPRRLAKLNAWERDFIFDIEDTLLAYPALTKMQAKKLTSIWEKATAEG